MALRWLLTKLMLNNWLFNRKTAVLAARVQSLFASSGLYQNWNAERRKAFWFRRLGAFGAGSHISANVTIHSPKSVRIGQWVNIAEFVHMWGHYGIEIGDNTLVAAHAIITSQTHNAKAERYRNTSRGGHVTIGHNCWIGSGAIVLPGLTVGDNAIVGSGAVVTRDVPANAIVIGVPARIHEYREPPHGDCVREVLDTKVTTLDAKQFETTPNCPLCGSSERRQLRGGSPLAVGETFGRGRFLYGEETVASRKLARCSRCSLVYHTYRPTSELLHWLYDVPGGGHRWASTGASPAFERSRHILQKRLPSRAAVLDIGANHGDFLFSLPRTWERAALEPMADNRPTLRDLSAVYAARIDEDSPNLPYAHYDAVVMLDVCEHMHRPLSAFRNIYQALKPGGILLIETGDSACLPARLLGGLWSYLNCLDHVACFDRAALQYALRTTGFRTEEIHNVYHTPPDMTGRAKGVMQTLRLLSVLRTSEQRDRWRSRALAEGSFGHPPVIQWPDHLMVIARRPSEED